ncbi:DUF2163 domain-containing protein [Gemmobacter serpentinus]|uniref:DUF2163 domain-containing protein n=1 Tax=Gemmobacter serpentinus TaxID=2652247 RepID=UPI00124E61DC|nr:DUF2163 domain-containing protein [Gemmobacter serpentinus]
MTGKNAYLSHMASGTTTACQAWAVTRRDGVVLGFTDHDRDLSFEGITFKASSGMTARALQQSTGLAVDNSEAIGALSDAAITEADVLAGRYDRAELRAWAVNWADTSQRMMQFRGSLGELTRVGGSFSAELRGLAEQVNQVQGRVYHRLCGAALGDRACRFVTDQPGFTTERAVQNAEDRQIFCFAAFTGFEDRWFERGRLIVLDGDGAGLEGVVKADRLAADGSRSVEMWQAFAIDIAPGDRIRLIAGCDKRAETCLGKFNNFINFRGFPHIPGEDWISSYPTSTTVNDGGRLR